ncbi:MAG: protein kinase [Verrucomicrobiaceae bacterium]|nr:protein kinase [Verrucomicrobiaceae bacterium]
MTPPSSPEEDPLHGNPMSGILGLAAGPVLPHSEVEVPDHWEPPTPAHIAVLLPQYQIEKLIGRGGMGAVYRGKQITLQRPVAIKVLPAELARNSEFVARFHREAQLLASLSHQGIVTIFDFGQTTEGHLYFVMEYVDGTDLNKLIHGSKSRLDAKQALSLTVQICEAMQYAHDNGVVHRDIKPANVLVTKDGRAKLADFGLAMKPADPGHTPEPPKPGAYFQHASIDVAAMRFTQPGAAMGTPDYAAPEVYEGKADERSDIYALGIMLYEMLTGAPPKGYFQLPSVMAPVDHRVDKVVVKALEIDPGARYQKVEQMKADVQAATQPLPPQPPAAKPPTAAAPTMPRAVIKPPSQPRAVPGASRQPTPKPPVKKSAGAKVFMIICIVAAGAWALFHFFTGTTQTSSATTSSVAENASAPEFAPSNGETWVDGLAAYWAGDWKDDTLFAREGVNGVRGLKERAVFWPLDPKTKPMRDVAIRVLWRWPDTKDPMANRPAYDGLGIAFRSSVKSNTSAIKDNPFQSGYFAGITVTNKDGGSSPSSRYLSAIDSGGKEFGEGGPLKELDRGRAHTFEVRAVGKSTSFRMDGNNNALARDWSGKYNERGQAEAGLIQCLVPQGAIIDRFEYAILDKPGIPDESTPDSPKEIAKEKPLADSPAPMPPVAPPKPSSTVNDDGFTQLLDKAHQSGWKYVGSGEAKNDNGTFSLWHPRPHSTDVGMYWYAARTFTDFVLRLEFMTADAGVNSGIFLRTPPLRDGPQTLWIDGSYEFEIKGDETGAIPWVKPKLDLTLPFKANAWNDYEVTASGQNYSVKLNGVLINTFTGNRNTSGYIAIQCFTDKLNAFRFRNVRIKELPSSPPATTSQFIDVKLDYLAKGAYQKTQGYRPLLAPTSSKRPASITKAPNDISTAKFGDTMAVYGEFKMGRPGSERTHAFIWDRAHSNSQRLFVDSNANGDLTDDPPARWEPRPIKSKEGSRAPLYGGEFQLDIRCGDESHTAYFSAYIAERFDPGDDPNAYHTRFAYYPDYARSGTVTINGKATIAVLTDAEGKGDFSAPTNSLFLDLNGDGKFNWTTEAFLIKDAFRLGDTTCEIAGLAANGASFQIIKSKRSVIAK